MNISERESVSDNEESKENNLNLEQNDQSNSQSQNAISQDNASKPKSEVDLKQNSADNSKQSEPENSRSEKCKSENDSPDKIENNAEENEKGTQNVVPPAKVVEQEDKVICKPNMHEIEELEDDEEDDSSQHQSNNHKSENNEESSDSDEAEGSSSSSDSSSSNDNNSESSKNEQDEEKEEDYSDAIKLEKPFYEMDLAEYSELNKTASFGEAQDLLGWMPSFAKFGLLSSNIKNKLEANKGKTKTPDVQAHEVGPEYLSIDPAKNLQSGFFYLSREDEKTQFEK